ncbi:MAG: sensor histidine kinase [Caulobacteraceae bacterium]|nr:sensor histidine kinase [Caulobacteraceae bacterium]
MSFQSIQSIGASSEATIPIGYASLAGSEVDTDRLECRAREAAVAEERNRIAREIHDTLAQGLAAIRLQLELAAANDELPPHASEAIELAQQIANENFIDARRLISTLRSPPQCLASALSAAVERAHRLGPAKVSATLEAVSPLPGGVAHELLRIAQEAISNAERHARAREINVNLRARDDGGLEINVSDDGDGFDPDTPAGGFGLAGMHERASAIHAGLAIASAPGAGARVTVTWTPARDWRTAELRAQSAAQLGRPDGAKRVHAV